MVDKAKESARQKLRSIIRTDGREERSKYSGVVVALDIDEVLALVHPVMIELYNKEKGTHYTMKDHTDWDFKGIGSNYLEMMVHYTNAWKDHWGEIALGGDRRNIIELGQYFVTDIASARDHDSITGESVDGTDKWIRMQKLDWMPYFYDSTKINKKIMEYTVNVDDSPRLANSFLFADSGFLLLVDKPYNRHISDSERILRVEGIDRAAHELIEAAIDVGREKRHYQTRAGQRFINEGLAARDSIVAESLGITG